MLKMNISISLDGFVAGPNQSRETPLGEGGEQLHDWVLRLRSWREAHGMEGGETGVDDDVQREDVANIGATIMGRNMFGPVRGPWGDEDWRGWWGDEPPFHHPVFVLTHHAREPLVMQGGTTFNFVTEGIESALRRAQGAAGGKDVAVAGGASAVQQYLRAGLLDEIDLHIVPVLLGAGARLLDGLDSGVKLEQVRAISGSGVTHVKYRVSG